ncbi:hypothetical protein HK100_006749, partial [Physocladia obscura]
MDNAADEDAFRCALGHAAHSFFVSYRVAHDAAAAVSVAAAVAAAGRGQHAYLDRDCLVGGAAWAAGFVRGLEAARVVLPLLSPASLASLRPVRDNVVLEWELAVARMRRAECLVLPLLLSYPDAPFCCPPIASFPNLLHDHPGSPRARTLRQLVRDLLDLRCLTVRVSSVVDGKVSFDSDSVARIMQLHRMLTQMQEGTLLSSLVLTAAHARFLTDLDGSPFSLQLDQQPCPPTVLADILDWKNDLTCRILLVPDLSTDHVSADYSVAISTFLIEHNAFAGLVDCSSATNFKSVENKIISACGFADPRFGRLIAENNSTISDMTLLLSDYASKALMPDFVILFKNLNSQPTSFVAKML